jgi:hypothetical protein
MTLRHVRRQAIGSCLPYHVYDLPGLPSPPLCYLPRRSTSLQDSATTRHQLPHTKLRDGRGAVRRRLAPDSVIRNQIFSAHTKRDRKSSGGMFLGLRLIGAECGLSHPLHELAHNCTGRSVVFIGDINLVEWPGVVRELFTRPAHTKGPP